MAPLGELFACPLPKEAPNFKTAPQGSCFSSTFFLSEPLFVENLCSDVVKF